MINPTISARFSGLMGVGWILGIGLALAQPAPTPGIPIPLTDLSAFKTAPSNWHIVGAVRADLNKANTLTTEKGTGVLANTPADASFGQKYNLLTNLTARRR